MPTKEELERMDMTQLAVLCQKVSESPTADPVEADQGRQLKQEWAFLIHSMTPPLPALKDQQANEAEVERLKRRMVSFLAAALPKY
jgi:hypothetical protein